MYVGVDIGGSKTLLAALDDDGVILTKQQFPTPKVYDEFVEQLRVVAHEFGEYNFRAGCVAIPGRVDREHGIGHKFGNLPWQDVPIQKDIETIFRCPMLVEHDSALGGLSESKLLPPDIKVLYVTISTGIGTGLIDHQTIVPELANSEGGQMLLPYHGKWVTWESFASGRAIVERFGKKASEITDEATWRRIAHDLSQGFIELIAITQPDRVVIGGSVGRYFDRFKDVLEAEIRRYPNPLIQVPVFQAAARPDDAVVYGCYDFAKARYATNT